MTDAPQVSSAPGELESARGAFGRGRLHISLLLGTP